MRLTYFGTPEASVPPLRALVEAGHDVVLVVTQPDKRRSRGAGSDPSPVKAAALELGLPVLTPDRARDVVDDVAGSGAELGVVVAFGQLLPVSLLDALPLGFLNVHFSLLPRWRGAAPVERAILAGDAETGVELMRVEAGLDTGPVFASERVVIDPADTAGTLRARLVAAGARLLVEQLPRVAHTEPVEQVGEATYAEKLTIAEFRIDPTRPAHELERLVRAGDPRPGAWFRAGGQRYKVFGPTVAGDRSARPGTVGDDGITATDGLLVLSEIQPEGKRRMPWEDWRRGRPGPLVIDRPDDP